MKGSKEDNKACKGTASMKWVLKSKKCYTAKDMQVLMVISMFAWMVRPGAVLAPVAAVLHCAAGADREAPLCQLGSSMEPPRPARPLRTVC